MRHVVIRVPDGVDIIEWDGWEGEHPKLGSQMPLLGGQLPVPPKNQLAHDLDIVTRMANSHMIDTYLPKDSPRCEGEEAVDRLRAAFHLDTEEPE